MSLLNSKTYYKHSLNRVFFFIRAYLELYWGYKNKKLVTNRVTSYEMEAAGFEPASRGPDTNLSTCVVY